MKHTKGPWEARKLECDGRMVNKAGWEIHTPNYDVCTLVFVGAPIRKEADANLIAAAPELLKALENIRDTIESCFVAGGWVSLDVEEMQDIAEMARAAIAKARGEDGNAHK